MKDLEPDYASAPSDCTKPGALARFTRRYNLHLAALGALIAPAALFLSAGPAEAFGSIAIEKSEGKLVVNWNPPKDYDRSKITGYWAAITAFLAALLPAWPQNAAASRKPTARLMTHPAEA